MRAYAVRLVTLAATVAVSIPSAPAWGQTLDPSTGHYYERVDVAGGIDWLSARDAAASRTLMGSAGHLATITSAAENAFIVGALGGDLIRNHWLGGYQTGGPEPGGGWTWITGEAFTFTNWNGGEPNNAGNEQAIEFQGPGHTLGGWNDANETNRILGYIVEASGAA